MADWYCPITADGLSSKAIDASAARQELETLVELGWSPRPVYAPEFGAEEAGWALERALA